MGFVVPPIRIRDNVRIEPEAYVIKMRGEEVARGNLVLGSLLAMGPNVADGDIEGIRVTEPVFGLPAVWISEDQRSDAEISGLRKYGDFWVLKEYYDDKGNPTEREYEYYTMYRISRDHVDDLIERAISGLDAQTEEEQTARERVREILNDGI